MHLDINNSLAALIVLIPFAVVFGVAFTAIAASSKPLILLATVGVWALVIGGSAFLITQIKAGQDQQQVALQQEAKRVYGINLTPDQAGSLAANVGWDDSDPGAGGTIAYDQGQSHLRVTLDRDTKGVFRLYSNGKELPEVG